MGGRWRCHCHYYHSRCQAEALNGGEVLGEQWCIGRCFALFEFSLIGADVGVQGCALWISAWVAGVFTRGRWQVPWSLCNCVDNTNMTLAQIQGHPKACKARSTAHRSTSAYLNIRTCFRTCRNRNLVKAMLHTKVTAETPALECDTVKGYSSQYMRVLPFAALP